MNKQPKVIQTTMETAQWFIFLLASSVAIPIVIGAIFEMNSTEVSGLMQRTFFVVGLTSFIQAFIGHRLPIVEGPAGIWISIFAVMAVTGVQSGIPLEDTLRTLETTMIFTGFFLFLFGVLKLSQKILPIFTPLVTGTFFLLLTVQLSGTFLKGMLGLQGNSLTIQLPEAAIAFFTFFVVLGLSSFARGWLSSYAVFIGIMIGWIMHIIFIGNAEQVQPAKLFSVPEWFAFGIPAFDMSVIPMALITAIILISNLVASIVAMNQTLGVKDKNYSAQVNRGTAFSGIGHGLAGMFSAIANVPLAVSSGFIALTGQHRKRPFLYAALLLTFITFFPPLIQWISSIPSPIANAALMATFVQLVGLAINNLTLQPLDSRKVTIAGISYLIGMGTMFLPAEVFAELPSIVQNVMSNGLLLGTGLVIILEQLWKEKER
ncbi:MAG TPA: purine/pyrimidine permease [Bacillota bacterium]|nr:purine/pyrimidine permease [Bacillota bacterium]